YLARLGWSHGDDEVFTTKQFVEWFDLRHVSRSPAQFNPEKLLWLNQQYMKTADLQRLADLVAPRLKAADVKVEGGPDLTEAIAVFRDRATTVVELADQVSLLYREPDPSGELLTQHLTEDIKPVLRELAGRYEGLENWDVASVTAAFDGVLKERGLKMPKLAIPLRVLVFGTPQTPAIHGLITLVGRRHVVTALKRLL
ncbi:MAG TPA: glutamate--tRNA ligase, partial [Burkholderiales bacterium]|nr:glutamate--tRNA ligase [Burkholderiales bacterium]